MLRYLIDTNVVSELQGNKAEPAVKQWFMETPPREIALNALTVAEIYKGIHNPKLTPGKKRELQAWDEKALLPSFTGQIVFFDEVCAAKWGEIVGPIKGTPPVIDTLIAATALAHNLTLVTRNVKDFDFPKLTVLNPWN